MKTSLKLLGLSLLMILYVGYYYGTGVHLDYLPRILHLKDPTLLAADWTITHSERFHFNVLVPLALVSRLVSLPLVFLLLHGFVTVLFLWSIRKLSFRLFDQDETTFLLTVFVLLHWGMDSSGAGALGASTLYGFEWSPHGMAVPFCILAFYYLLEEKYLVAACFAGVATDIHLLLGMITMMIVGAYGVLRIRDAGPRQVIYALLLYALLAAPTIGPLLRDQWTARHESLPPHVFIDTIARFRLPHHHMPSTWPLAAYLKLLTLILFGVAGFKYRPGTELHERCLFICGMIAILCLVSTIFVEIIPVDLVAKFQFFRMTIFIKLLAVLYIANYLRRLLTENNVVKNLLIFALLVVDNYGVIAAIATLLIALDYHERRWLSAPALALSVMSFAGILYATAVARDYGFFQPFKFGSAHRVLLSTVIMAVLVLHRPRPADHPALVTRRVMRAFLVVLFLILVNDMAWAYYQNGFDAYFRYDVKEDSAWGRLCAWAKDNTGHDEVFITPPYIGGFRLFAERAIVADFAMAPIDSRDPTPWKKRLEDLSNTHPLTCSGFDECGRALSLGYNALTEDQIRGLARQYNAAYFVTENREDLSLERLYQNEEFSIYRTPRWPSRLGRDGQQGAAVVSRAERHE